MRNVTRVLTPRGLATVSRRLRVCSPATAWRIQRLPAQPAGTPSIHVRLRPLGHTPVELRPGTTDGTVVWATFAEEYHRPPEEITPESILNILDLGANIGLTVAHFGVLYPQARVRGYELHEPTAELARANIAPWSDRCSITTAAVWHEDGSVPYRSVDGQESGNRIDSTPRSDAAYRESPALSLNTIIGDEVIDYIKMDVEGAEREILRNNLDWAARVRAMKIEVHEPYTVGECLSDTAAMGFRVTRDLKHPAAVLAVKES